MTSLVNVVYFVLGFLTGAVVIGYILVYYFDRKE